MSMKSALLWIAALLVLSFVPLYAQSQATTGSIEGIVTDQSGAVIPNAEVEIQNTETNFTRRLTSDAEGRFRGVLLPLGQYKVTVKSANFGTLVREGISLGVGQTVNLALSLNVSAAQQTVSITADAPVIETSSVETSTFIDQNSVRNLPNNGRNFFDFVNLTPGVSVVQGPDGNEISINGQRGVNNNVSIDGADDNNPFFGEQRGGQRPPFTVNLDAVKEVNVVADGAPAEFGRSSSGFVNVVTKSGTNEIHGTAHEFQKWTGLTSRQSDGTRLSGFSQEQFGGTIGGPIRKDKLFYFGAYDQQIFRQTKQTNPNRIDPALVNFLATRFNDPGENLPIKRTNDANAALGKVDWSVSPRNLATFRYNYSRSRQENGTFDVDPYARSANAIERDFANVISGSLNTSINPTTLNEFRGQWSREDRPRPYSGPVVPNESRPFPDTGVGFAGYRFGEPFFIPVEDHDTRVQFVDNVSVIRGAHSIKFGGEFNRTETVQTFLGFANGRYIFDSVSGFINYVNIGPKFVECSNGTTNNNGVCPAGSSITGPLLLYLQFAGVGGKTIQQAGTQSIPQDEPAFFIQDRWQVRPNLTISYGLRWEAQIEPPPITPPSQVFYSAFVGKPAFPSNGKIPSDFSMWQPRLGITWDPSKKGKSVVRLNAGIFNARTPGLDLASTRSTNGSVGQTLASGSFANAFGTPPTYPDLIPNVSNTPVDHPQVYIFDKNFRNPRTYTWGATFEQEIFSGLKAYAGFNYAKGVHLQRFINRNDPVFGSPWATGLGSDGKNGIDATAGSGLTTLESSSKSLYRGLTIGMVKQYSHRVQFQWNYQYSKDYSDDDNERDPFSYRYISAANLKPEYNFSDRDQRHRFNAWAVWQAPWGLEFSPRFSAHSAQPCSVGVCNTGSRLLANGTILPRNTLRKDNAFSSFDFRVDKNFKLSERVRLLAIVDVFNLANSKNLKKPEVTGLLFNFDGTLQSGLGDPRQEQLGLKLVF